MATRAITKQQIVTVFEMLYGENIIIKELPGGIPADQVSTVGRYVRPDGSAGGWFCTDLVFAAAAGGALTMLPPDIINSAVREKNLSANILENLNEVLNICTSLFQAVCPTHVSYEKMGKPQDYSDFPKSLTGNTSAFEIQIPRYGKGKFLTVVC